MFRFSLLSIKPTTMLRFCVSICLVFFVSPTWSQTTYLQKQILTLINESRSNPGEFLKNYRDQIQQYEPKFIPMLEKGGTLPAMAWDESIEAMAKELVNKTSSSPAYKGKNSLCGFSTSKGSGEPKPPIYFVCDMFSLVHNPDYTHLGIYFNEDETAYAYMVGKSCKKHTAVFSFNQSIDTSSVDYELLNTAKDVPYMSEQEKAMVLELNFVRVYPAIYAKFVAKHMSDKAKGSQGLSQAELSAGQELIAELEKAESLRILKPDECVYTITKLHGQDCEKRGVVDHKGSDGSDPFQRLTKGCPKMLSIGENLAGNIANNPREPVIALLIDDGVQTRGHRYTILAPQWKYVSCYRFIAKKTPQYNLYGWVQTFTR